MQKQTQQMWRAGIVCAGRANRHTDGFKPGRLLCFHPSIDNRQQTAPSKGYFTTFA